MTVLCLPSLGLLRRTDKPLHSTEIFNPWITSETVHSGYHRMGNTALVNNLSHGGGIRNQGGGSLSFFNSRKTWIIRERAVWLAMIASRTRTNPMR